ncbi:MAG: rod shape-determining protein MreD [Planctomycetaceae bacterium]
MIVLLLGLSTYAALVIETSSGLWSLPVSTMPQFLFLVAAVAALRCRGAGAIAWAVIAGLPADVAHGGPLGLNVVLLANLTFLSQLICTRRPADSVMLSAAFVLIYVSAAGAGSVILHDVLSAHVPDLRVVWTSAFSRAGGTAAVYLVVATASTLLIRTAGWIIPRRSIASDRPRWAP